MTDSNKKGDRRERELVNWLDEHGWAVIRAPASGSATERELPDVLAGNGEQFYAIETKASSGDPIYYTHEEVSSLVYFAESFGAEPRLGARFDTRRGDPSYGADWPGHYLFAPEDVYVTAGQNYRVTRELAHGHGVRLSDL